MEISKILITTFLLLALLLQIVQAQPPVHNGGTISADAPAPSGPIDCKAACSVRCSDSKRPNLCQRACGTCCKRCSCVPPGTSGNYDTCPCYATLTTTGGKLKCP